MEKNESKCLTRFLTFALVSYFCLLTVSLFAEPLARDNAEAMMERCIRGCIC